MHAPRFRPTPILAIAALTLAGVASAASVQENAIRDGCKKYYNEMTQKAKYQECVAGKSARSRDALIDGCYARYKNVKDKLRECLGR